MSHPHAIEHGSTRAGRWVRQRRLRFTLWLAAAEGLLYVVHLLHWWEAVALAVITVGFWFYAGRASRSDAVRQVSWILAAAQLLVLLIPLVLTIAKAVAIALVALLAVAALIFLFTERERR
jgi:signal transduction histidine kinase